MKLKILLILISTVFILSSVSSAFAANYDGYDTITVKQGDSFELDLLYNEWVDSDGYNSNKLTLTKKERSAPIDGYWANMYTFKADQKGKTSIKVKIAVLWWEEERTVDVNIV
jgi:hypothetical protein